MTTAVADIVAAAIAEGRHAPASEWRTVCDGCGQWVRGIWRITIDKKRLCRTCAGGGEQTTDLANAVSRSSRGTVGTSDRGPNGHTAVDVTGRSAHPARSPASTAGAAFFDVLN